jgi:C-terminal peptidase prc
LILAFGLISCEKVTPFEDSSNCSLSKEREYVYNYMQQNYLWYQEMPEVDYQSYSSAEALLEDLKVSKDHWSFIIDKKVLDDYFSGEGYIGFGFKLQFDSSNKLIITMVYPNSPASKAGLKRGVEILAINGKDVDAIKDINSAFGPKEVGVEATLDIVKDGQNQSITLKKEKVETPSVISTKVLNINGEKVGYLLFDSFIEPSTSELKKAFEDFANANIDSLIVDLRYNGGGLVSVANDLVSLIKGLNSSGNKSMTLEFNDKNSNRNSSYYIKKYRNSFDLVSVYFLTTKNTCSSSEAVINALKPYEVDVKLIGSKTCGKPVGMVGGEFCNKYLVPIEFQIVNRDGDGDYFGGMSVDCRASDDIYHDFGDTNEAMLKEAAYLIEHGSCSNGANARVVATKAKREIKYKGLSTITKAF